MSATVIAWPGAHAVTPIPAFGGGWEQEGQEFKVIVICQFEAQLGYKQNKYTRSHSDHQIQSVRIQNPHFTTKAPQLYVFTHVRYTQHSIYYLHLGEQHFPVTLCPFALLCNHRSPHPAGTFLSSSETLFPRKACSVPLFPSADHQPSWSIAYLPLLSVIVPLSFCNWLIPFNVLEVLLCGRMCQNSFPFKGRKERTAQT